MSVIFEFVLINWGWCVRELYWSQGAAFFSKKNQRRLQDGAHLRISLHFISMIYNFFFHTLSKHI